MRPYTTEQILERLKKLTGARFDNDLAIRLGVSKQSLAQYKNKKTIDIQQKIIHLLLEKIEITESEEVIEEEHNSKHQQNNEQTNENNHK